MSDAGETTSGQPHLVRGITKLGIGVLILNGMIGAGIFALPGEVAGRAGALSPWLFLAVGLGFIPIVLVFSAFASYAERTGGPVEYARMAFGPLVGFNAGWLLYIARTTSFAANVNALVLYLAALVPFVGTSVGKIAAITILVAGFTYVNVRGVKDGVRTVFLFTILKLTPIFVMIILSLQFMGADTLLPDNLPTIDDLGGTVLLMVYAFIGFESALIPAGEMQNPRRNIPRVLITTMLATGVLYFLIMLAYMAVLPTGGDTSATLTDVGRALLGGIGAVALSLAAIFSIAGNLAGGIISAPRITFGLAEDGLLPKFFKTIHPTHSTPHLSVLFFGALTLAIALSGTFAFLAVASSLSRLLIYVICFAGLPVVAKRADEEARKLAFILPGGYLIPALAMAITVWLIAQAGLNSWLLLAGLLVLGYAFYWIETKGAAAEPDA